MDNKVRNFVIIIVIIVVAILAYSLGIFAKNVIANSESETAEILSESGLEIESEIPNEISESDFDYDSDDLTDTEDCTIIIEEVEAEPTVEDIIMNECGLAVIDYVALIDSYEDGNWYAYYICSDGDCYVITLKNNHVDVCCQLN
jgi:hypothetical protein